MKLWEIQWETELVNYLVEMLLVRKLAMLLELMLRVIELEKCLAIRRAKSLEIEMDWM